MSCVDDFPMGAEDGVIGIIGIGVIGSPLLHRLQRRFGDRIVVCSDKRHAKKLRKPLVINGDVVRARVVTKPSELDCPIDLMLVCVKNYSLEDACESIAPLIDERTVLFPLQNGLSSGECLREEFPKNIVLEGYVLGPNTRVSGTMFTYQNPGVFHVGATDAHGVSQAEWTCGLLSEAGLECHLHEDILTEMWKKLMLNVAGNAMTALTGLDYSMMKNSKDATELCTRTMREFREVANARGIPITNEDSEEVMRYFVGYRSRKRTSMLEDVLKGRKTENEYLAGYIVGVAKSLGIDVPCIETQYRLMRMREQVYLGEL